MVVSDKVRRVIAAENISAAELEYMLTHSAITSLRSCNRRYFLWVFQTVESGGSIQAVEDMQYADPVVVGRGDTRMFEEHADCEGSGCKGCGWIGQIFVGITDVTARGLEATN